MTSGEVSFRMMNYNSHLETSVFWAGLGGYEPVSMSIWLRLLKASTTVLDVGANTGLYSIVAKSCNRDARVIAFEPITRFYERLQLNCRMNGLDIDCYQDAISDFDGVGVIFDLPEEHHYHASLSLSEVQHLTPEPIRQSVNLLRLDTFAKTKCLEKIDLVKIDVEGHEAQVLRGMSNCLASMRPSLLLEIKSAARAEEIGLILEGLDYLYFDIDERAGCTRVGRPAKSSSWNVLCCQYATALSSGLI